MAPQFTLYSHRGPGPNPLKTALVLEKLGLTYDVVPLDFGDDPEKGVKGEKFLKVNPNGRVPALVDHNNSDFCIWESGATMVYLAEKYDKTGSIYGKDVEEKAIVMQWLAHQLSGLGPVQGNVNFAYHCQLCLCVPFCKKEANAVYHDRLGGRLRREGEQVSLYALRGRDAPPVPDP